MAEGHLGSRPNSSLPFTKIFTAFRIALDLKKMALAAAGIFATSLGWWVLCLIFYTPYSIPPQWKDYEGQEHAWKQFKLDRLRWNFLHFVAGPTTNNRHEAVYVDAADVASDPKQFEELKAVVEGLKPVQLDLAKEQLIGANNMSFAFKPVNEADLEELNKVKSVPLVDIIIDDKEQVIRIAGKPLKLDDLETFRKWRSDVKPLSAISPENQKIFVDILKNPPAKKAGKFRACPWNEDRGENPYLLTMHVLTTQNLPFGRGGFFGWLLHDQLPLLAEPLVKFISPIYYLFLLEAGGWRNWTFLVLVILWNMAVWGYFGGAICRLAAVQFARNEKIPITEAIAFVNQRYKHFFLAPFFPLLCVFLLTIALGLFGLITGWTHLFGDIVIAGLMWPIVIVLGLIMGVLLIGLFGWPLMYPTIAVEGSDSFDALSRPYNYVFQKPWHYLGYAATALAYGAAVVFFVGFMGSLTVYLGQWGFNKAPGLASDDVTRDRTPVYFFAYSPTSFGWRDLFLHDSVWAKPADSAGIGTHPVRYELKDEYVREMSWNNRIGAYLVAFWLGAVFLLVVGFGYSYFWTASTILYFLMRKLVDDTEFDEIYLEEDDLPPPPPPATKPAAPEPKPGVVSLNVVEAPKASP